jgi:hypothetical protein
VYKLWNSILRSFLQLPITWYVFCPKILLSTLFSNNFSLCPSLSVRDQASQPCKPTRKTIVLYILNVYASRQQRKRKKKKTVLNWMLVRITRILSALNFLMDQNLICCRGSKIFNFSKISKGLLTGIVSWVCCVFCWWDIIISLEFSTFMSSPAFLLASIKVSCFSLWYRHYLPVHSHHQHKPTANVFHSIYSQSVFLDLLNDIF